jgi:glycine/D-amino acid oxidase-like deaminating enzyme
MKVAVIGGGIQGTCLTMELALRGVEVDLIEASPALMDGASRHNEGKIHLGFVYANDPSLRTAELMFRGAIQFAPLMRRWLGSDFDEFQVSTPFNYAVHNDSLLSVDQLEGAYREIAKRMQKVTTDGSYFGIEEPHSFIRQGTPQEHGYGPAVDTVFASREIAMNPGPIADLIVKTVADMDTIHILSGTTVTAVDPRRRTVDVGWSDGTAGNLGPYEHIVNCAWRGRPALDASAGLLVGAPWTFRMKYFLLAELPPDAPPVPSTTIVLGSFGDLVHYGAGAYFLSWYPSGRLGWSTDLTPPQWPTAPGGAMAMAIAQNTLQNLAPVVPGVEKFNAQYLAVPDVRGGVIYALGDTDVEDPKSGFHRRSEIGLRSSGNYHTVDTGKYTTAPMFAIETADRITGTR